MDTLSFTEFVEFVRQWARLSENTPIAPETELEKHLGISGDDGRELLQAVEKRFNVTLFSPIALNYNENRKNAVKGDFTCACPSLFSQRFPSA
jgi:hypothetical protein